MGRVGGAEHGTGAAGGHGGGGEVLAMEIKDCMLNGDLPAAGLAIKCGCAYVNRSVDGAREMVANESRLPKTGTPPRWAVFLMLVVSMALWGGTWPVGRVVAASFSPWNAALLRFAMATAVLVPMCLRAEGRSALRVRRELLPRLLVLGATGIFGYSVLFFSGLRTTPAGRAALIVGCIPACIALGSCLVARRWARLPAIGGILLSLIGVAVVIANGNPLRLLSGTVHGNHGGVATVLQVMCRLLHNGP